MIDELSVKDLGLVIDMEITLGKNDIYMDRLRKRLAITSRQKFLPEYM